MDVLSNIELLDFIRKRKIKRLFLKMNDIANENVWYVTELCCCSRKHYLRVKYPWLGLKKAFENKVIFGEIFHRGIESMLGKFSGVYIEKKFNIDGREVVVKGKADAVYNNAVYEFKTTRRDLKRPKKIHEKQVLIYMELLGIKRGYLVYLNTISCDFKAFFVKKRKIDVKNLLKKYLEDCVKPEEWECRFCEYSSVCEITLFPRRSHR